MPVCSRTTAMRTKPSPSMPSSPSIRLLVLKLLGFSVSLSVRIALQMARLLMASTDNNGSNWIIYRLPDIMLLEAEALCQQMEEGGDSATIAHNKPKLDKAFQLVNAINKRAICKAILTDKDTLKPSNFNTKSLMEGLVDV